MGYANDIVGFAHCIKTLQW